MEVQQVSDAVPQLEAKNMELEEKVAILTTEIERLNQILQNKSNEIDEWRMNYAKMEQQCRQCQITIQQLEDKIALLSQEIERLNQILEQKRQEIEGYRERIQKFEYTIMQMKQFEDKVPELENRI